jgi:hypothetical protein
LPLQGTKLGAIAKDVALNGVSSSMHPHYGLNKDIESLYFCESADRADTQRLSGLPSETWHLIDARLNPVADRDKLAPERLPQPGC